ncbi:MAG: hypothetical protein VXY93_02415 [Pseudomonadota bacterium]|nr:hypothetical protein [Pseudomonadota bacterium]
MRLETNIDTLLYKTGSGGCPTLQVNLKAIAHEWVAKKAHRFVALVRSKTAPQETLTRVCDKSVTTICGHRRHRPVYKSLPAAILKRP